MAKIVILGSGFASCTAVKTLRKLGCKEDISVVSPKAELFYYPSLIWVPSGKRKLSDLSINLDNFYRRNNVVHKAASVTGLDPDTKTIKTDAGDVAYDYVIVASGGRYIKKLPGMADHAHIGCEGWEAISSFSDKLNKMDGGSLVLGFASNPKEPSAMRGGPVFEYLFGIDNLLRKQGRRDKFNIHFVSPAPKPGARLGEKAVQGILSQMKKKDITPHLGNKMKGIEADKVMTEAEEIPSDLTLFIPGMTGPAWAAESGLPLSDGGFIKGDEYAKVPGHDDVYITGDAGSFPGPDWKPKQAHMADLQAEAAAKNLVAKLNDNAEDNKFKNELICIIDSVTSGTLVFRDEKKNFMLPCRVFHWAKVFFEKMYLKGYR